MALNFSNFTPANIGANFMAGRKEAQDLETGRLQQQEARMKLEDFQRKQAGLDQFLVDYEKHGQTGDPEFLAGNLLKYAVSQRNPELITQARTLVQTAQQRKKYNEMQNPNQLAGVARPVAPAGELGSGTFDPNAPAPTNALAPMAASSAMTPTNALAPRAAAPDRIVEIKNRLFQLNQFRELPEAKAEAEMLVKEYDRLTTPHVVGGSLMSGSGSIIGTAPKEATPLNVTQLIKARDALLPGDPNIAIYNDAIRKETQFAPRAVTNVNMPPQEKAEQGERGKMLVTEYSDISKAAKLAAKTLPSIEANLNILNNGFKTGFGTETIAAGANVLSALGVPNAEKVATNAQTFLGSATQAVLQKQLEQKGPQTESDAQRIQQTGAQLGNTVQANQFMLSVAKSQLKRDMEQRNFYDSWWKNNKTYDGAESAWYAGEGGKSLFDRPELKAYKEPTAASAASAANRPSLDSIFKSPPAAGAKGK